MCGAVDLLLTNMCHYSYFPLSHWPFKVRRVLLSIPFPSLTSSSAVLLGRSNLPPLISVYYHRTHPLSLTTNNYTQRPYKPNQQTTKKLAPSPQYPSLQIPYPPDQKFNHYPLPSSTPTTIGFRSAVLPTLDWAVGFGTAINLIRKT